MYKTIASRLTAHFNPDGGHLQRYLNKRATIIRSICEDLILHDQILIPTTDFLAADGLILIIGEKGFLELLEKERIKFIRTRCIFGYVRGKGEDGGLGIFSDPDNKRPQDSPMDESVSAGLSVIENKLKEKQKLKKLIVENTVAIEMSTILDAVRAEAITDLKESVMWKPEYEFNEPNLLVLPGMKKMQVRVIGGEHDPKINVVDTLLALVQYNSDLYLADKFDTTSTSPFFPVGDFLNLKANRIHVNKDALWELFEVNGIPDLSVVDLVDEDKILDLHRITTTVKADSFRKWFHSLETFDRKELLKEYISIIQEVPWSQKLPTKILRFVVTMGLGVFPGISQAASFFDAFVFDRLFQQKSPKFFIDDLNRLTGMKELQPAGGANSVPLRSTE